MDSLSSAPGNRNNSRLLSAAFAIAASVSGAVNAATNTPNLTEEPAGSPKIISVASAQKAILDMLPPNHPSRASIAAAIKTLEDGGSTEELTKLLTWAQTIASNAAAPQAARDRANEIMNVLTPPRAIVNESPAQKKERLKREKMMKNINDALNDEKGVTFNTSDTASVSIRKAGKTQILRVEPKGKPKDGVMPKGTANYYFVVGKYPETLEPGTLIKVKLERPEQVGNNGQIVETIRLVFRNKKGEIINNDGDTDPQFFTLIKVGTEVEIATPKNSEGGIGIKVDLPLEFDEKSKKFNPTEYRMGVVNVEISSVPEKNNVAATAN